MLTWPLSGVRVAVGFAVAAKAYTAWEPMRKLASGDYLTIPVVAWVPLPPAWLVPPVLLGLAAAAVALMVGRAHRVWASICAVSVGYMISVDYQLFSNHTYLMGLMAAVLAFTREDGPAPRVALMGTLSAVYLYSGVAKLNPEFLSGSVLGSSTPLYSWGAPVEFLAFAAVAAAVIEMFLGVGFWFRSSRRVAVAAGVALHVPIMVLMSGASGRLGLLSFTLLLWSIYPLAWCIRSGEVVDPAVHRRRAIPAQAASYPDA